jgi:hypothetical protein
MNKAEKIRRALLKYPKASVELIMVKCGCSKQDIYNIRYKMKKQNKANGYPPLEMKEGVEVGGFSLASSKQEGEFVHYDTNPAFIPTQPDMVNHPPHYTVGGVETIDFIEAKGLNFNLGNVVKYLSRAGEKDSDPLQDLQKARWYLDREIARVE